KASDGIPFTPLIAGDPLGEKSLALIDFPDRRATAACESAVNPGNPAHYIRTECFAFPSPATRLGNSGRNALPGPGLVDQDSSLLKTFSLRACPHDLHGKWSGRCFNALRRPNFMPPLNTLIGIDTGGRPVTNAGPIDTAATPSRQLQFALKLVW